MINFNHLPGKPEKKSPGLARKSQITNYKLQTNSNDQNSKQELPGLKTGLSRH
jgi:hypothetical protein